ncbi:MAG: hypothetical protein FJW09_00695 [Actinobacteria bacterium]|nr:hypothetical protein [Actinomycetota bacterium]
MRFFRAMVSALTVASVAVACSGEPDETSQSDPPESPTTVSDSPPPSVEYPTCDQAGVRACLLPWPDDRLTVPDDGTPTGRRLAIPADAVPVNVDGRAMDVTDQNRADGFSPSSAVVFAADGVDLAASGVPDSSSIEKSVAADARTTITDTVTGERVPFWGELDIQSGLVTLRPAVAFTEGHTIEVSIAGLVDETGAEVVVEPSSWTFTIASAESLSGRLLTMRDGAYESIGDGVPNFTVDTVTDGEAKVIEGTFEIPNYLDNDGGPGGSLLLDADGAPRINDDVPVYDVAYRCVVPRSTGAAVPALLYGHGLLGNRGQVDFFATFAAQGLLVGCAVDWLGMASEDIAIVGEILTDMGRFNEQADRMLHGHVAFSMLGRLTNHPSGFASNPAFQNADGSSMLKQDATVFVGNSQGGILGGAASAVSSEWTRAVLGVPGMNYSLLLPRSTDWPEFQVVFEAAYTDVDDRLMALMLVQLLWDRGENSGYAQHLTSNTYDGIDPKVVLLVEAFGDHQVANVSTEMLARTIGARVHSPALREGRSLSSVPLWGIEPIVDYGDASSKLVMWDYGTPPPPVGPRPPIGAEFGRDPHGAGSDEPNVLIQALGFLLDGTLIDVCGGPCVGTQIDQQ